MSELKPCPHCGGKIKLDADEFYMFCCDDCGLGTTFAKIFEDGTAGDCDKEEACEKWNRRAQPDHAGDATAMVAQPDNAPLTLEELRGMDGEPVWVTHSDGSGGRWGIVNSYNHGLCADVGSGMAYWFDDYIGNVAYRRKPEPEGGHT